MLYPEIMLHGQRFAFIGTASDRSGAIARPEDYQHGRCSYAHLYADGEIKRFNSVIGHREEIQFTGEMLDLHPDGESLSNVLRGGWLTLWED